MGAACAGAKPPFPFQGPAPKNASDLAMAKLAERFLDARLKLRPVEASYVGLHRYDGNFPDLSDRGLRTAASRIRYFQRELRKIDRRKLSTAWAIDHELIEGSLKEALFGLEELKPHEWDVQMYNQIIGGGFYYITVPPADPADWPVRLKAVIDRLEALPRLLAQAKKNLKNPPKVFTDFAIAQNAGNLKTLQKQLPKLFAAYPELGKKFEPANAKGIEALRDFQRFLEKDLLPRSNGDWRLGASRWQRKLQLGLRSSLSGEALYQAAERQLELARFEMYDIAVPLYKKMWPQDHAYRKMLGDARINHVVGRVIERVCEEHSTPKTLFSDVQKYAAQIKDFIRKSGLITLPPKTDHFVIEPTPAFLDGLAVAFYNPAPAFEPDLKKSFWISSVPGSESSDQESYLREYNNYILQALTIHEAFPGHYVQMYWSSRAPHASITKQVLESGTMAEGWAVMIEELMHEAGFASDDPKNKLFHLKMKLRTFINAMIDHRLHTATGDRDEMDRWALDLMMSKGFQERAEAVRKLRRAKLTSTQLSTYFVGYREMMNIYRDGQKRETFESRPFLEKMLSFGTIPPRMIRRLLKEDGQL